MEEYPLYQGKSFLGYMGEDDCRKLLRERRAKLIRRGNDRKIILNAETVLSINLMRSGRSGPVLRTMYMEDVYQGQRTKDGPAPIVTGRVRTLMKYNESQRRFMPWGDTETFRPGRYNPDKIRNPLFAR